MARTTSLLVLASCLVHAGALRKSNAPAQGQEGPVTSGFLVMGIESGEWCAQTYQSIENLRAVGLKCRDLPRTDPNFCGIAFVGDEKAVSNINEKCAVLFDKIVTMDFNDCGLPAGDPRPKKICVRSMGMMPWTYNIQMDSDTIAVGTEIERVFDVLHKGFDMTASFECCARHELAKGVYPLAESTLLHGWEMQTGVMGYVNNRAVVDHAKTAIALFTSPDYPSVTSAEQNAETMALTKSDVHFLPLPPNFNMRSFTAVGFKDLPMAVAHWDYDVNKPLEQLRVDANNLVNSYAHSMVRFFTELWQSFPLTHGD